MEEEARNDKNLNAQEKTSSRSSKSSKKGVTKKKEERGLSIEGYQIEGISIAGHETCVIVPSLSLAFDIGKCPQRAISQQFLFISHGHMDHIVCFSLHQILSPLLLAKNEGNLKKFSSSAICYKGGGFHLFSYEFASLLEMGSH